VLGEELATVDLEIVCIEGDISSAFGDLDVNGYGTLVRELAAQLDIVDAKCIVLWFDTTSRR
jgi:hypothetical protein